MRKYQIEADVSGYQKPRVFIQNNSDDKMIFCLHDWDTQESEEGWSRAELEELISTLQTALEKSKYINTNESTEFLFKPEWDL